MTAIWLASVWYSGNLKNKCKNIKKDSLFEFFFLVRRLKNFAIPKNTFDDQFALLLRNKINAFFASSTFFDFLSTFNLTKLIIKIDLFSPFLLFAFNLFFLFLYLLKSSSTESSFEAILAKKNRIHINENKPVKTKTANYHETFTKDRLTQMCVASSTFSFPFLCMVPLIRRPTKRDLFPLLFTFRVI